MRKGSCFVAAAMMLGTTSTAFAGHVDTEEVNVVIMTCRVRHPAGAPDRDSALPPSTPGVLEVESVSVNSTRHAVPHASVGGSCAQYLHEFLTEGFEIVNRETAGFVFVLTRHDKAFPGAHH